MKDYHINIFYSEKEILGFHYRGIQCLPCQLVACGEMEYNGSEKRPPEVRHERENERTNC